MSKSILRTIIFMADGVYIGFWPRIGSRPLLNEMSSSRCCGESDLFIFSSEASVIIFWFWKWFQVGTRSIPWLIYLALINSRRPGRIHWRHHGESIHVNLKRVATTVSRCDWCKAGSGSHGPQIIIRQNSSWWSRHLQRVSIANKRSIHAWSSGKISHWKWWWPRWWNNGRNEHLFCLQRWDIVLRFVGTHLRWHQSLPVRRRVFQWRGREYVCQTQSHYCH